MLSGAKRRRQRRRTVKNNNGSNQQKSNFTRAAHFFCTFLGRCFARLHRETSRRRYTLFGGNVVRVLVHFFFTCIGGRQHFSFCHRRHKIFMLSFQQKNVSFVSLSLALDLCRFFSRSASLAYRLLSLFPLSFSCSIFQICGHDN